MVNSKENNINVMVFENPEFGRVRTMVDENRKPLFCGKDVCDALGYKRPDKAVNQHVNDLDVLKRSIKVPGSLRKNGGYFHKPLKRLQFVFHSFLHLVKKVSPALH